MNPQFRTIVDEFDGLDEFGERMKHLYAAAGLALYHSQLLEEEAVIVCLYSCKIRKGWTVSDSVIDEWDRELSKQTLGQLAREVEQLTLPDMDLVPALRRAVAARNELAHIFFRTGFGKPPPHMQIGPLVIRLMEIADAIHVAERRLEASRNEMLTQAGADMKWLDREVRRFMEGAADDPGPSEEVRADQGPSDRRKQSI